MLKIVMCLILLVISLNIVCASDYTYNINMSSLPSSFTQMITLESNQDETLLLSYGNYISGPDSVELMANVPQETQVVVSIPKLNATKQTSQIRLSNSSTIDYTFNIINDPTEDDFWITSDKDDYFINETVFITLYGTNQTILDINISGCNESQSYKTTIESSTAFVIIPKCEDTYKIIADFSKQGKKIRKEKEIFARSKFSCQIESLPKLTFNESVTLNADIAGGKAPFYYRWTFPDESTNSNAKPKHAFTELGSQKVLLRIKDSRNEETYCDLNVDIKEETYDLELFVKDADRGSRIGDAEIEIEDTIKKTNKNGFTEFKNLEDGKYRIQVTRDGYEKYSERHYVDKDTEIVIELKKIEKELSLPTVNIRNVDDEQVVIAKDLRVIFDTSSTTTVDNCKMLVTEEGLLGYTITDEITNVTRNTNQELTAKLGNGDYLIKIGCENQDGIGYSPKYYITGKGFTEKKEKETINQIVKKDIAQANTKAIEENTKPFKEALASIKEAEKALKKGNEITIAFSKTLSYEKQIKDSITIITNLLDQAEGIESLNIAEENKASQRSKLLSQLHEIKAKTPKSITLKSKERVIEQVSVEKTEEAVNEFLASRGRTATKKEIKNMVSASREVQDSIITYTDVGHIQVEFLNGRKQLVSIIKKNYKIDGNLTKISVIENIPKSVANSVTEINFNMPYEIIKEDPIVRVDIKKNNDFIYYVDGEVSTDSLKSVRSIAFVDNPLHSSNFITGLAIFSGGVNFAKSGIFLIVFVVIALIGTSFITRGAAIKEYAEKSAKTIVSNIPKPQENKTNRGASDAIVLLTNAIEHIKNKNDSAAIKLYPEILKSYSRLNTGSKAEVQPIVNYLSTLVDVQYMSRLLDDAMTQIIEKRIDTRSDMCQNIESGYSNLSNSVASKIESKYNRYQRMLHLYTTRQTDKLNLMLERENGTYKESEINDVLFGR